MASIWCKHYRGMHDKTACEAGVEFASLPGHGVKGFFESCPCFGPERTGTCIKSEYPTAEEMAAEAKEMESDMRNMMIARVAIVSACGGPWKRGTQGSAGVLDCPVCNSEESLRYSRSGYNGHIHASCSTEGCVSWIE